MNIRALQILLLLTVAPVIANSQSVSESKLPPANLVATQSVATSLANLPESDVLIYINPRRILTDAAPKVMSASDFTGMQTGFEDLKKGLGVDPRQIDSVVLALRFHKPAADLSFVPPEAIVVVTGDFSADSLMTIARLSLQEKARDEKHGTHTIAITKIDPIAAAAEKNPLLKAFAEIGFAPINTNTLVVGNVGFVKAALDAAEGAGRVNSAAISSLLRDPDALISATGSPLAAFTKSFGLLGTQANPRDSRCETTFGNFYAALTMVGTNFTVRGAMNADNPDTARIILALFSGLSQQAISSIPDKSAQELLNGLKLVAQESEIVLSAAIPASAVTNLLKQQSKPATSQPVKKPPVRRKRPVRRK